MKMVRMSVPADTSERDRIMKTVSINGFWRKMREKGEKGPERW